MNSCHAIVHANVFLLVVAIDITADTPTIDAGGPPWTERWPISTSSITGAGQSVRFIQQKPAI
jgi:hypothetical protein